jgi:hypothetical protein
MNRQIIFGHASEFAGAVLSVFNRVGHRRLNLPRIFGMDHGFVSVVLHTSFAFRFVIAIEDMRPVARFMKPP